MASKLYQFLQKTPARYLYRRFKSLRASQSNESEILRRIAIDCPKTFVEFGFHPSEYNCIGLGDFAGLLIDGDEGTVRLAQSLLPERVQARHRFLAVDDLDIITSHHPEIGVLSIDVDGNDFWFLEALLPTRPHVISVEYNASFGLQALTVPYDPTFERHAKHPSGWYHGASLAALTKLCERHGFKLVDVANAGANAFFVRNDRSLPALDPSTAYRENALRNRWSKTTAVEQWESIKGMPLISI